MDIIENIQNVIATKHSTHFYIKNKPTEHLKTLFLQQVSQLRDEKYDIRHRVINFFIHFNPWELKYTSEEKEVILTMGDSRLIEPFNLKNYGRFVPSYIRGYPLLPVSVHDTVATIRTKIDKNTLSLLRTNDDYYKIPPVNTYNFFESIKSEFGVESDDEVPGKLQNVIDNYKDSTPDFTVAEDIHELFDILQVIQVRDVKLKPLRILTDDEQLLMDRFSVDTLYVKKLARLKRIKSFTSPESIMYNDNLRDFKHFMAFVYNAMPVSYDTVPDFVSDYLDTQLDNIKSLGEYTRLSLWNYYCLYYGMRKIPHAYTATAERLGKQTVYKSYDAALAGYLPPYQVRVLERAIELGVVYINQTKLTDMDQIDTADVTIKDIYGLELSGKETVSKDQVVITVDSVYIQINPLSEIGQMVGGLDKLTLADRPTYLAEMRKYQTQNISNTGVPFLKSVALHDFIDKNKDEPTDNIMAALSPLVKDRKESGLNKLTGDIGLSDVYNNSLLSLYKSKYKTDHIEFLLCPKKIQPIHLTDDGYIHYTAFKQFIEAFTYTADEQSEVIKTIIELNDINMDYTFKDMYTKNQQLVDNHRQFLTSIRI